MEIENFEDNASNIGHKCGGRERSRAKTTDKSNTISFGKKKKPVPNLMMTCQGRGSRMWIGMPLTEAAPHGILIVMRKEKKTILII